MSIRSNCFGCTRSLIIIVNLLVGALAVLFIYVSVNAFDQQYDIDTVNDSHPKLIHSYVTILFVGIGLIIAILALLGLIGSVKRSKSILGTYAAIVSILVSLLILVVFLTFSLSSPDAFNKEVDKGIVNSTVILYNFVDASDKKTQIIDRIQRSFACCGINSPTDWTDHFQHKIPKSCCSQPVESSLPVYKYCSESDFKIGCWKALTDHMQTNMGAIRLILYIFIAFGAFCALSACFMIHTMRKNLHVV